MTRITNTDQVILLLRAHLQQAQRATKGTAKSRESRPSALERVQGIARAPDLTDEQLKRALVAGLLEQEFGAAAASDPKFQQVVEDVVRALERVEVGGRLLGEGINALKTMRN